MTNTQHKRGRPTQGSEAKTMKYQIRLTPTRKQQLTELSTHNKCSMAEVVDLAIDLLYQDMKEAS